MMSALEQTYAYLEAYHTAHGIPPTMREIGEAFGLTAKGAQGRLDKMETLGWIKRDGRHRSIVLMGIR